MLTNWSKIINPVKGYDPYDKLQNASEYVGYWLSRTQSMLEYNGLPDTVPERNLKLLLQGNGYCCFPKPSFTGGKVYAMWGGLGGTQDPYYMPTICTVANPALDLSESLKIGEDCVIVPHDSLYMGLLPVLNKYARLLTEVELTMYRASINARTMNMIVANSDESKKSADKYLEDLEAGKLGVVSGDDFLGGVSLSQTHQTSSYMTQLIELEQYFKASMMHEVGINANYNMKRETLHSAEAEMNDDMLLPFVDDILKTQQEAFKKVNAMCGTNITVDLSSAWKQRREANEYARIEQQNIT